MALLEVAGLTIDHDGTRVLDDVSLLAARGDRLGIAGGRGPDKVMISLVLGGLMPAGAKLYGSIRIDDKRLPDKERERAMLRGRTVGILFENPRRVANPRTTIGAQIVEAIRQNRRDVSTRIEVPRLLSEVGLRDAVAGRRAEELSVEDLQQAQLAIALAGNPKLLICAEATSMLDAIGQRRLVDTLLEVTERRDLALVVVAENPRVIAALTQKVVVLENGRTVDNGKTSTVFTRPSSPYTKSLLSGAKPVMRGTDRRVSDEMLLGVEALTVRRRDGAQRDSGIDNVSFDVMAGECVALTGPAWSGKSRLLRVLAGLDRADSGLVALGVIAHRGFDMPRALRRDLALVAEDPVTAFDPRRSVGDAIGERLALEPSLMLAERRARIDGALADVGLGREVLNRLPRAFSVAVLQKIALARALVTRPRLILLDEPLRAVEAASRSEIVTLLMQLRAKLGISYLLACSDPEVVGVLADRVMVFDEGRIVEQGRPGQLLAAGSHKVTKALIAARLPVLSAPAANRQGQASTA